MSNLYYLWNLRIAVSIRYLFFIFFIITFYLDTIDRDKKGETKLD